MKKNFVKALSLLLIAVAFTVFAGCQNNAGGSDSNSSGNSESSLVGTWTTPTNAYGFPTKMILKADGTGDFTFTQNSENRTWPGTWTDVNNVLTLNVDGSTVELSYSISGTTATFTLNGNSVTYTKQ